MSNEQKLLRRIRILGAVGLIGVGSLLWIIQWRLTRAPKQPIAFSHAVHAGQMSINCFFCHTGVQFGNIAGVPSVQDCMQCHQVVNPVTNPLLTGGDHPKMPPAYAREIAKLTDTKPNEPLGYWERKQEIDWHKIYKLPKTVQFSHKVHVAFLSQHRNDGVTAQEALADPGKYICVRCHANVPDMTAIHAPVGFVTVATGNMNPNTTMGFCIDCHRHNGGPIDCTACHR